MFDGFRARRLAARALHNDDRNADAERAADLAACRYAVTLFAFASVAQRAR
jgi:hypothetical protein